MRKGELRAEGLAVEAAFKGTPGLAGGKDDVHRLGRDPPGGCVDDCRLRRRGVRRGCVDCEGAGGRALVLVSGGVLGSEGGGVGAVGEAGEGLRAGAVGEGLESIRHWILAVSPAGVPAKVKVAWLVAMVPEGPVLIVVSGGVVSTVKVRVAGVGSWFPAASWARKAAVWGPSVRPVKVFGLEQSAKGWVSIRHWILAVSPAGVPAKVKVAWSVVMVPEGRC